MKLFYIKLLHKIYLFLENFYKKFFSSSDLIFMSDLHKYENLNKDKDVFDKDVNFWKQKSENIKLSLNQSSINFRNYDILSTIHTANSFNVFASYLYTFFNKRESLYPENFGNPVKFFLNQRLGTQSIVAAGQKKHLLNNVKIEKYDYVVEFGPGYFSLANSLINYGKINEKLKAKYYYIDLPDMLPLQIRAAKAFNIFPEKIHIDQLKNLKGKGLFIAVTSLSETPITTRKQIMNEIKKMDYYIVFQNIFGNFNNSKYFKKLALQENSKTHIYPLSRNAGYLVKIN